jgi:type I restriction enzyme S subunit
MRNQPSGWDRQPLGSLIESAVDGPFGSSLKSSHYVDTPGVRVVRLQNIGDGVFNDQDQAWVSAAHAATLSRHEVRAGDVLVASLGDENHPYCRSCVYPRNLAPGIVKADCFRLRFDPALLTSGYCARLFNCPPTRMGLSGLAQGVTRDRVNLGNLLKFWIPVPPVEEQRAIAAVLDALDDAIHKTEQIIAKLQQVKQGLLHDLLTRGIDDNGELRDPERHPEQFQDSPLGRIPNVWSIDKLTAHAAVTVGYVGPTNPFYTGEADGVLFLRTGNITARGISLDDVRWVTKAFHASQPKSALQAGDIVVSRVGYTGTASIIPDLGPINCANMIIIRAGTSLRPTWVQRLFETTVYGRQVFGFTAGSAQPVLNIGLVERLLTPVPPIPEQDAIVKLLVAQGAQYEKELAVAAKLRTLKSGLAEDLLTGRVRTTSLGEVTP